MSRQRKSSGTAGGAKGEPRAARIVGAGRAAGRAASKVTRQRAESVGGPGVVRVLCVDDHPVMLEGLRAQFGAGGVIQVVGGLRTAERLLAEVARLHPDIVLMDIEMPGPDVFEMADRLRHMHPSARVIMLSVYIRDVYISAAYRAGVGGYFTKSDEIGDIAAGIREVAASPNGTFVLGAKVRERFRPIHARGSAGGRADALARSGGGGRPQALLDSLTARETEVLRLIGKGLSRVQIAEQLSRSVKTIDGHQEHLMKKLGIASRAELMRFAIREGLSEA